MSITVIELMKNAIVYRERYVGINEAVPGPALDCLDISTMFSMDGKHYRAPRCGLCFGQVDYSVVSR